MAFPLIDHLVYACSTLDEGLDRVEALLGVRPALGGRHPGFGTHNALLSLGPTTYLEVIAPDPTLARPVRGLAFGLEGLRRPKLSTWALRCEAIDEVAARSRVGLGSVLAGTRQTPDGTVLEWRLTDPFALPLGGAVPFLIAWGDTPHPAGAVPKGGTLVDFRVLHPEPERVRSALDALGAALDVDRAENPGLTAGIRTEQGRVELR